MGDPHRYDFFGEKAGGLGRSGALLAAQGKGVLVGARHLVIVGDIVSGLRHRIHAVLLFHQGVDKTPADGGVFQLHVARERRIGLAHDEGRTGHRLDATGNRQFHFAAGNRPESRADRVHARGAQAVEVTPGTLSGKPASNSAMRATLRLSSPAWLAQPRNTSSTAFQSTDGLRSISALIGSAAKSSARTLDSPPRNGRWGYEWHHR